VVDEGRSAAAGVAYRDVGGRATQEQLPRDAYLMGSFDLPVPV